MIGLRRPPLGSKEARKFWYSPFSYCRSPIASTLVKSPRSIRSELAIWRHEPPVPCPLLKVGLSGRQATSPAAAIWGGRPVGCQLGSEDAEVDRVSRRARTLRFDGSDLI